MFRVLGGVVFGWAAAVAGSAVLGSGEGVSEPLVGVGEVVTPWPVLVDAHDVFAGVGDEASSDVQEPVADGFGFGSGEGAR